MSKSLPARIISPSDAQCMVSEAVEQARKAQLEIAVAVCDPFGYLVAFGRTSNVAPPIGEFALDKAYTAATLRKSSKAFGERMVSVPTLSLGLSNRNRYIAWGGGVAIFEDKECIGAIGVSGAQEHEDIELAEAVIRVSGLTPG